MDHTSAEWWERFGESDERGTNQYSPRRPVLYVIGPSIAYLRLTRGQLSCIEVEDAEMLGLHNWSASYHRKRENWYAVRNVKGGGRKGKQTTVKVHSVLLPTLEGYVPDHINGNGLDNRRHNLRPATHAQNSQNAKVQRNNKVGLKGVERIYTGRFCAYIRSHGKKKHLGVFDTPEQAHAVYVVAAKEQYGEFARA